jgi:peroxiredoxin Q/BCP
MRVTIGLGLAALLFAGLALSAGAADKAELKPGDKAPSFQATDDQGKDWKSEDHVGKKIVVIYFYPADFTGGCTKEACAFRDESKKLTDKGIEVIGVSGDSAKNHELFKKHHKLEFTLLADEDGAIAKKYGIPTKAGGEVPVPKEVGDFKIKRGVTEERWTVIIGKDGKVIARDKVSDAPGEAKRVLTVVEDKGGK